MIKKILMGFVALVVILVVAASFQSADFRVERSATISAPASVVFAQVNDFHKWGAWSPWDKMDPSMKRTYEGAAEGNGAIYRWVGNGHVGEGSMTIIESHPSDLIRIDLEFLKPFKGSNVAEFTFKPASDQTAMTWSMTGKKNFVSKVMGLFMNMDKMIGGSFEQGLGELKSIAEAAPKK